MKKKWGIESNVQLLLVNLVFALTGSSIVVLRPLIFQVLGISPEWPFLLKAMMYIGIITPVYFVNLLLISLVFGQFRFFRHFTLRVFSRLYYFGGRGGNFRKTR